MKWPDKQRAWGWRQIRIVRAVVDASIVADPATIKPEQVLDTITEVAVLCGHPHEMEKQLTAWEQEHRVGAIR